MKLAYYEIGLLAKALKSHVFLTIQFLLFGVASYAQTISVTNVATTPVCAGSAVTITFNATNASGSNKYTSSTLYTIYLSNNSGSSFTAQGSPFTIAFTYNGSNGGTTTGITTSFVVPANTPSGSGYKISLGSTGPNFNGSTGTGASSAFTINAQPTLSGASQAAAVCPGSGAAINLTGLLASSTSTINYTINGTAQTPVTGVVASAGGAASFTSATLTAANNGQTLQITGITTTSSTPNCSASFTQNVTLSVNPTPTLTGASQAAVVCPSSGAIINLSGLLASSTSTINYTINGTAQTPVTGVVASVGGAASFTSATLTAANNGQTLQITGITTTSSTPNCSASFTQNVTLSVNPTPTLTGASQAAVVCAGSGATINLIGLLASSTSTVSYSINGSGQTPVTGVVADGSGAASFTSANLTAANNGQTLQITGITTTNTSPNCSQSFTQNVTLSVNARPTSVISGTASICPGGSATISVALTGAQPWSVSYFDGTTTTPVTGITISPYTFIVSPGSTATYTVTALSDANCASQAGDRTGSTVITVNPTPTLTGASQAATVCTGSGATINLTGLLASSTSTINYTINGTAQTPVTGVVASVGGAASFTSATLTAANNGQTLQITGITTTSSTPNCSASFTQNVTLSVNPTPTLTGASQSATVCAGTGATITLTGLLASNTSTVSYTINGAAQTPVTGVVADESGEASFTSTNLTAVNNGQILQIIGITTTSTTPNCSASFMQNVTLSVNPPPTPTFTVQPGASVCASTNVTYTTQSGQSNYVWVVPGVLGTDYTITSGGIGSANNTVTLQWLTAGSKTVTINYTDTNGCSAASATSSIATTVNALPVPTFTAQPGASACVNTDVTYTTQTGQSNYVWVVPGVLGTNYSITSGGISSTDNTVTLQWLTTGSKTVTIKYTDTNGCTAASATSSTATTVNALPVPTFTAQPGVSACTSTNVTYTTQSGKTNYVWGVPGVLGTDYTITSGGIGSANNTVTLQWLTAGSKTVTISYTNPTGCAAASATSSTATTVNVAPTPTFTSQPGASACVSTDVTYTTQSGQSNYVWVVPGVLGTDYIITSGGISSTDNTVTLQWLTTGSKTVKINYTNASGCAAAINTSSTATTVNALPSPTFTVQPGASACASTNVTYTTQSGKTNYIWGVPGVLGTDYTITSGGIGSTNNTVTLKWLTIGSKTVTINYTGAGGCTVASATSSTPTTVNALPIPTFTVQPGASACLGTDVTYTTQAGQLNYVWGVPGVLGANYTITAGGISSTDNTVTLQWLTTGSKTVTIKYTDTNGCTAASATSSTATTVNALPAPTFTAQPGASVCASTNVTYTTQASQSNYVWGVPGTLGTDYSIISGGIGSTSNTVTLQWLTIGSKTVTINYTNASGCTAISATSSTATTVNARPTPTFTSQPGAIACLSTDVTYTTQSGQSNYLWTVSGILGTDYSITSGGTGTGSNTVTLKWLTTGTKTVTINYTNASGCTATSATSSTATTVNTLPTITLSATAAAACYSTSSKTTTLTYSGTTGTPTTYSITWNASPANSFVAVTDASLPASPISITVPANTAIGTYTGNLTVKNGNGCVSVSKSFTVTITDGSLSNGILTSIKVTASATDIGNVNGSTVTLQFKNLTVGSYTFGYTIIGVSGTTYGPVSGTAVVSMATSTRKNTVAGTFTTGLLSTAGQYQITITSITPNSTGCSSTLNTPATFSVIGAFITQTSGTWDQIGVWSTSGTGPDYKAGTIIIAAGHTIHYDAGAISDTLRLDELIIYGTLIIDSDQVFELKNGSGTDMTIQTGGSVQIGGATNSGTVNGTMIFDDGVTTTGTSTTAVTFNTQSLYKHLANTSEGAPPMATWNSTSTFQVSGYTSTAITFASSNWSQSFGQFIWNCPSQTVDINMNGLLGGANIIQNGVTVSSTGTGILRFGNNSDYSLSIAGDLTVSGSSRFSTGPNSGSGPTVVLSMNNFVYGSTATTSSSWLCEAGQATVTISGNVSVNNGTVYLSDGGNNITRSGATVNLKGNLTIASGATLDASSSNSNRTGQLNFVSNAGTHSFTNSGTIVGQLIYQIASAQNVRAVNESPFSGTGTFTLAGTAKLIVESTNAGGAIQTGTAFGNITTTGARTFTSGSSIEYGRTSTAAGQYIGSGHPTTNGVDCIINNSSGVLVSSTGSSVTVGGNLKVVTGNFYVTHKNVIVGHDVELTGGNIIFDTSPFDATPESALRTITINGAVNMTGGQLKVTSGTSDASNAILEVNGDITGTNYLTFSGSNCRVIIGGTTPTTMNFPVDVPIALENLYITRPGATVSMPQALILGNYPTNLSGSGLVLNGGNLKMNASLTVNEDLTLTNGTLFFEGQLVELQRNIQPSAAGLFSANSSSTLSITGSFNGSTTDSLLFTPTGNTVGTLILNRSVTTTRPNILINTPVTVSNFLYLTDGEFYNKSGLNMSPNSTIVRTPNAAFTGTSLILTGGPYNVTYNNGTSPVTNILSADKEAQAASNLNNVTSNLTGSATLTSTITGVGALTVNTGTFTCLANAVNINSVLIASPATLNAPIGNTITVTGDFTNNGTFVHNSGTVIFNGTSTSIKGSTTTSFNNLTISSGTLTDSSTPKQFNIAGDFQNDAIFAANGDLVNFNGANTSIKGASTTSFNNLTISSGTLSDNSTPKQFNIGGDFQNNGAFTANGDLVTFNGTVTSIKGESITSFNNLTIGSGTLTDNSTPKQFNVGGNFIDNGTFTHNSGTILFNGTSTISGSGSPVFNHITILGTLTGPATLHLQGDFTNNGFFNSGSGSVNFEGLGLQNIAGTTVTDFYNINVSNTHVPVSVSVESNQNLKGILSLSANAVFDADGAGTEDNVFTLLSTGDKPTIDASVATLPIGASVIGRVTVQRYMGRAGVAQYDYQVYRDISPPVQGATVADIQKYIPVTGPFIGSDSVGVSITGGQTDYTISSLQKYVESVITDINGDGVNNMGDGWIDFPVDGSRSDTAHFIPGQGYSIFIFGPDSENASHNDLWALRGPINSGTISLPVTITKSGAGGTKLTTYDGWNLVGNPYPSTIDWSSSTGWSKTNISSTMFIDNYDWNKANDKYNGVPVLASYNSATGLSTNGGSKYIATGQGYWVKASLNTTKPALIINENAKVAGTQTNFLRESAVSNVIRATLSSTNNLRDETVIYFSDKASEEFDDLDALKRFNRHGYMNFSTLSPGLDRYAINSMPFPSKQKKIPLEIMDLNTGTYSISFTEFSSLPSSLRLQLEDKYEHTVIDIRENPVYTFKVNKETKATFGSERFSVIFGGEEVHPSKEIKVYPIPVSGILTIEAEGEESASGEIINMVGLSIGKINFTSDGNNQIAKYDFQGENTGVYFIRVIRNDRVSVIRIVKE